MVHSRAILFVRCLIVTGGPVVTLATALTLARGQEPERGQPAPPAPPPAQLPAVGVEAIRVGVVQPRGDDLQNMSAAYRPLVISELRFVRSACGLSAEQLRPITREAARVLKATARALVQEQKKQQEIASKAELRSASAEPPDPIVTIRKALGQAVQARVTAEQWSHYQDEAAKRAAHWKQAAITNLVTKLDFHLLLTADQRRDMTAALKQHWDESWERLAFVTWDDEDQVVPPIPDAVIARHLTQIQMKRWNRFQKQPSVPAQGLLEVASALLSTLPSEFDDSLGEPQGEGAIANGGNLGLQ